MAVKLGNKSLGVLKVLLIYTECACVFVHCGDTAGIWLLYKLYRFGEVDGSGGKRKGANKLQVYEELKKVYNSSSIPNLIT